MAAGCRSLVVSPEAPLEKTIARSGSIPPIAMLRRLEPSANSEIVAATAPAIPTIITSAAVSRRGRVCRLMSVTAQICLKKLMDGLPRLR